MEAAKVAAQRLSAGDIPATLNLAAADAARLGNLAHKWRNYYAIGALGQDLFYLMPDYKKDAGNVLLSVVNWSLNEWQMIDDLFVGSWEKWMGPVGANDSDLTAQLNGGLSRQLGQGMDEISAAAFKAVLSLISRLGDWFGKLTSGVPQGFGDSAFYWSDMFHYRNTFHFPKVLWELANSDLADAQNQLAALTAGGRVPTDDELMAAEKAVKDAETELAFALGWMTHCGTDVTGHPFTNAKCGGPFRLHWQRHHLVENHFDAAAYNVAHMGDTVFEELGTSALHFRIAFRTRTDARPSVSAAFHRRQLLRPGRPRQRAIAPAHRSRSAVDSHRQRPGTRMPARCRRMRNRSVGRRARLERPPPRRPAEPRPHQ
jgi:hypothetical protein